MQHVAAFSLIHRSKSETQGLLSRRGEAICTRLGLLHLGLVGQSKLFTATSVELNESSRIPVGFACTKTRRRHRGI
jgi:hypothetical protein